MCEKLGKLEIDFHQDDEKTGGGPAGKAHATAHEKMGGVIALDKPESESQIKELVRTDKALPSDKQGHTDLHNSW